MAIFSNIFIKTLSIFVSVTFILILTSLGLNLLNNNENKNFIFLSGDKNSTNSLAIVELSGMIIENNNDFTNFTNNLIISPKQVKSYLKELEDI